MKSVFKKYFLLSLSLGVLGSVVNTQAYALCSNSLSGIDPTASSMNETSTKLRRSVAGDPTFYIGHAQVELHCHVPGIEHAADVVLKPYLAGGKPIPSDGYVYSEDLRVDINKSLEGYRVQMNSDEAYGLDGFHRLNAACEEVEVELRNGQGNPVYDLNGNLLTEMTNKIPFMQRKPFQRIVMDENNSTKVGFYELDAGVYYCRSKNSTVEVSVEVTNPMKEIVLSDIENNGIENVASISVKVADGSTKKGTCDLYVKLGGE